jgi:hypothetical protein
MRQRRVRLSTAPLLLPALLACAAQLPPEPALRILSRERPVVLRLTSRAPVQVYEDGPGGVQGALLGETPLAVGSIGITKEIWKEAPGLPPPPPPAPAEERADGEARVAAPTAGAPAHVAFVWVAAPGAAPRRLRIEVPLAALQESYDRGRYEVAVEKLEPAPPGDPG